jgi:integral membrane protein (TIGR01906 family)
MKVAGAFARYLFIICLPLMLLTGVIAAAVNSTWLYTSGFEKYSVEQSLADNGVNVTDADLAGIARSFIHYFNSNEEYVSLNIQPDIFNTEEIVHFHDVKSLFRFDYTVFLGTFAYCLIFTLIVFFRRKDTYRRILAGVTIKGSIVTLVMIFLVGIGTLVNFNQLFYDFHLLVFRNSFWSVEGNMLLLFPDGFWYDAAVYCVVAIGMLAVILGGLAWFYLNYRRKSGKTMIPPG